ncbi:MAG: Ppx/GppA family phosphatase [Calditrichaeota bacterium]|nr:Ppx/GppA family phosphatase [Calditrichota bacterium]
MNTKTPERLAAIDIGTNSIHLIIARVVPASGGFEVLDHDKEMVRLGMGIGEHGELTDAAIRRALKVLKNFKARAEASGAQLRTVATSAVREASNRDVFVERARRELDLSIEVATGFEEAHLTYQGVRKAVDPGERSLLMVDIGGGSTEFVIGRGEELLYDDSIKLGAVRLTQAFFLDGKSDAKSVAECRKFCQLNLDPIRRSISAYNYDWPVGSSGTIECMGRMILAQRGLAAMGRVNRVTFSASELSECVERILEAKTSSGRAKLKGVDEGRADILVGGALLLECVMRDLKLSSMTVSDYSIREGILFDTISRLYDRDKFLSHEGQRFRSVMHLAKRFDYPTPHSDHVARLALSIFDQTSTLHDLGDVERELLEAAALLHDIGVYVSHSAHHKHSHYLIRSSQLLGFADYEQHIVALSARYHRKSPPRKSHLEFMAVPAQHQQLVCALAGILRIADGLDRTHASAVKHVDVEIGEKDVVFRLTPNGSHALDYAIWGAERKRDLFEETFKRRAIFVSA